LHRISLSTLESPNPTGNRFWRIGGHSLVVKNTGKELKHLSACNFFTYQLYSEKGASPEQLQNHLSLHISLHENMFAHMEALAKHLDKTLNWPTMSNMTILMVVI
jgi:hypothetical protein